MRRFDPKTPELRVHWLRFFASEKLPEGTRERHSIEACSIAIADVRFSIRQSGGDHVLSPGSRAGFLRGRTTSGRAGSARGKRLFRHQDCRPVSLHGAFGQQNEYTRRVLARISGRDELRARIEQLDKSVPARIGGVVRLAGARYFYYKLLNTESVMKLYMREGTNGPEKLLVDPQAISGKDVPSAISYFWPSSDGRYVVYGISMGGSEKAVLHILDTATARDTGETIDRADFNDTIGWLPGSHSFLYNRLQKLRPHAPEAEREIKSRVYLHVIGTNPERDKVVFGYGLSPLVKVEPADIPVVETFPNVPFALGVVTHGSQNEISIYAAPLDTVGQQNTPWRKICGVDDAVTSMAVRGDDLWLLTHKDASRFKIIHTHLSNPDLSHADVVVPASNAVVTTLAAAQDALYVQLRDGAVSRLLRIGYEPGSKPEPVALPYDGAIGLYPADSPRTRYCL
jgi:prolyl oligopeptidase